MSISGQEGDMATQLHKWATQEMHFHPQGAFLGSAGPSVEQLRRICRGTQQADIWNYIVKSVRSVQTVRKVKGNLQLSARSQRHGYRVKYKSDGRYDDERHRLLAQRAQLQEETTSVLSETRQLEEELSRMETDIQSAESEYQQEMESVRDLERKTCLMQVYGNTCNEFNANMDALADRVLTRSDTLIHRRRGVDTALHCREEAEDAEASVEGLETAISKEVRVSCEHISQFLQQALQGSFGKDRDTFHVNKEQLWKQVKTTLSNHSIAQVVSSLVQHSHQEALTLKEHTMKISIQKDAEKLRFKYEKGGILTDTATQPSALHSIRQLLEKNQGQHVMRFVETERQRNSALPLLHRLQATRQSIQALIQKKCPSQPGTVQMSSKLVQCQLDVVADRTAVDWYRREGENVRERVAVERSNRDALMTLHAQIQHFQQLANAKQNLIQVVAKQNTGALSRLAAQQLDVTEYINRSIPAHPMAMQVLTAGLRGMVVEEVNKVAALSLPYLLHLHLDSETKRGILDLSINFMTHPTAVRVRQHLHSVLRHLHLPAYKAPECVLKECLALKEKVRREREDTHTLDELGLALMTASGFHTDFNNVAELCEKVKARDREEMDKLLPLLQKRINKAARASTECITLKDYVQTWWEQPAQFLTPWVTADAASFQHWFNKWKIIVTKIRQLDLYK